MLGYSNSRSAHEKMLMLHGSDRIIPNVEQRVSRLRAAIETLHRHSSKASIAVEQVLSSLCGFLTTIIVFRFTSEMDFGRFATCILTASIAQALHHYAVNLRATVLLATMVDCGERREKLGVQVLLHAIANVVFSLAAAAVTLLVLKNNASVSLLAGMLFYSLSFNFSDFVRRLVISSALRARACAFCAIRAAMLLVIWAAGVFWQVGTVSASVCLFIISAITTLSYFAGIPVLCRLVTFTKHSISHVMREMRNAVFMAGAGGAQVMSAMTYQLVAAALLSPVAAGVFRATQTALSPFTIVVQAMENHVPFTAARAFAEGGDQSLRRTLACSARLALSLLIPCSIAAIVFAKSIIEILYPGASEEYYQILRILIISALLEILISYVRFYLRTLDKARSLMVSGTATVAVSVVTAYPMISMSGLKGAAWGYVLSKVVALCILLFTAHKVLLRTSFLQEDHR